MAIFRESFHPAGSAAAVRAADAPRAGPGGPVETLEGRTMLSAAPAAEATVIRRLDASPDTAPIIAAPAAGQPATNVTAGGLNIVLKEGPRLQANPVARAAFHAAADYFKTIFSDPVTVVIDAE